MICEIVMPKSVEASFQYGGLMLKCDDEAFARLRDLIYAEPCVEEAIASMPDRLGMRFISVGHPIPENADESRRPRVHTLIPTIIVSAISGVALIIGYVAIARWLFRLFA
jgi:hypothetical protein